MRRRRPRDVPDAVEVTLAPAPPERLRSAVSPAGWARLEAALGVGSDRLRARTMWMVNSTAAGGGVAELLRAILPYWRGAGFDQRWAVIQAPPAFFTVTKRIHNFLHGHPGDGGELGARERRIYERSLAPNAAWLRRRVRPGDIVVLHDPQTAGLAPALGDTGASIVLRSHVGADQPSSLVEVASDFLAPYVSQADAVVFTRAPSGPRFGELPRVAIIAPCIDPCSTKNREMDELTARALLARIRVRLGVDPLVVHLTRWDRLKDPIGVIDSFAAGVLPDVDARLVVGGPPHDAVADDPEAEDVYREVERHWGLLPRAERRRIDLVRLSIDDPDEQAAVVNALQRQASVVVKKSLEEGFGLGVTEAMWKRRPVVASRVGGHTLQIVHDISGVLVDDPRDLIAFGAAVAELLVDRDRARRLGESAHQRVKEHFLPDRYIAEWIEFMQTLG